MPGWERWYPNVFEAACDLGLIRARVCAPSSLLLSNRHAGITSEAIEAFRRKWDVEYDPLVDDAEIEGDPAPVTAPARRKKR